MKAVQFDSFGPADVLKVREVPEPVPGPGQVQIRVESASVNFSDVMRRRNDPYPFATRLPFIPGGEVAGQVHALGEGVEGPPVGTPVFALVGGDGSTGYAQYAIAEAAQVIPIPPGMTMDQAAAIVIAGATAILTLREVARTASGETVLIQGAGGAVGGYAIQIARLLGAGRIIGVASTPERRKAGLAAGADHVVDHLVAGWAEEVLALTGGRGADVVLELSGGATFTQAWRCLAPFGRFVVLGMASGTPGSLNPDEQKSMFYDPAPNQSIHAFNVGGFFIHKPEIAVEALTTLIGWIASGQVIAQITENLPLEGAADAHTMLESRLSTGKLILKPWL